MRTFLSHRHSALAVAHPLFSVVLIAFVCNARAGDITYNFVNYPVNETYNGTPVVLSGTIVTDGALGTISASDIVGGFGR